MVSVKNNKQQARRAEREATMFTLWDVSLTIDYGEVLDETEAYNVMYEEGLHRAVMSGYVDGMEFAKELIMTNKINDNVAMMILEKAERVNTLNTNAYLQINFEKTLQLKAAINHVRFV